MFNFIRDNNIIWLKEKKGLNDNVVLLVMNLLDFIGKRFKMLIFFIVFIYNVEGFLLRCLDSIIK